MARRTAWLQGKGKQAEPEHNISFMNTEICPDTETVPEDSTDSSNEFVERSETETLDSDYRDVIPLLDGPAEECLTPGKEVNEEDSVKEEIMDLTHLPTSDDTDSFNRYIKLLDQEQITNKSEVELKYMNVQLARKTYLQNESNKRRRM